MVQDQLVEYISSQLKLGIARDTVKTALTGVGWAPLDVEDTLKKVESSATPSVSAQPAQPVVSQKAAEPAASAAVSPKIVSFSAPGMMSGQAKNPAPQAVRVSDLVSAVAPASGVFPASTAPKTVPSGNITTGQAAVVGKDLSKMSSAGSYPSFTASVVQKKKGIGLLGILEIVLIVLFAALSGYLFLQNNGLNSQLQAQGGTSQTAAQSFASQIQTLSAANTALTAQVASATAENQDLAENLSFFVLPVGSPVSATSTPISIAGTLAAGLGKSTYFITTSYGVKVFVKNSADAGVAAALQPLLGTTVQLSGTYIPGTPNVIVTSVNGASTAPPPAATSTSAPATVNTVVPVPPAANTTTVQ